MKLHYLMLGAIVAAIACGRSPGAQETTANEPPSEGAEESTGSPESAQAGSCDQTVEIKIAGGKLSVDKGTIADVKPPMQICWTVTNETTYDVIVQVAGFRHLQFEKDGPTSQKKYQDPLKELGNDDGIKQVRAPRMSKGKLIRTQVRRMAKKDEFNYQGCYKYSVYVALDDKPEKYPTNGTHKCALDPRLEYDDDGDIYGEDEEEPRPMDRCDGAFDPPTSGDCDVAP